MKNIIWGLLIFLTLVCKSSEKTLNTSFEENQQQTESLEKKKVSLHLLIPINSFLTS
jgi:hypothetical protein